METCCFCIIYYIAFNKSIIAFYVFFYTFHISKIYYIIIWYIYVTANACVRRLCDFTPWRRHTNTRQWFKACFLNRLDRYMHNFLLFFLILTFRFCCSTWFVTLFIIHQHLYERVLCVALLVRTSIAFYAHWIEPLQWLQPCNTLRFVQILAYFCWIFI